MRILSSVVEWERPCRRSRVSRTARSHTRHPSAPARAHARRTLYLVGYCGHARARSWILMVMGRWCRRAQAKQRKHRSREGRTRHLSSACALARNAAMVEVREGRARAPADPRGRRVCRGGGRTRRPNGAAGEVGTGPDTRAARQVGRFTPSRSPAAWATLPNLAINVIWFGYEARGPSGGRVGHVRTPCNGPNRLRPQRCEARPKSALPVVVRPPVRTSTQLLYPSYQYRYGGT